MTYRGWYPHGILAFILSLAISFAVVPDAVHANDTVRMAFVLNGPIGDYGWNYAHNEGRKHLDKVLGDRVETLVVEDVAKSDAQRVFEQLAQKGYDVVFGTTWEHMDPLLAAARKYPEVYFEHCSGYKTHGNMTNYWVRSYQAYYLAGIAAAHQTESKLLAYNGAFPMGLLRNEINAFALGARSVDPDINVLVNWAQTWYDPVKEKESASSLIEQGADVVAMHLNTPATLQAAESRGVWGVAWGNDMSQYVTRTQVTAALLKWGIYYEQVARSVLNGTWSNEPYLGTLEGGVIDIAPIPDWVKPGAAEAVKNARSEIIRGERHVFEGPLRDRSGTLRVPAGETLLDYSKLQSMEWYVPGVQVTD